MPSPMCCHTCTSDSPADLHCVLHRPSLAPTGSLGQSSPPTSTALCPVTSVRELLPCLCHAVFHMRPANLMHCRLWGHEPCAVPKHVIQILPSVSKHQPLRHVPTETALHCTLSSASRLRPTAPWRGCRQAEVVSGRSHLGSLRIDVCYA